MYGEQSNFSLTPFHLKIANVTVLKIMVLVKATLVVSGRRFSGI